MAIEMVNNRYPKGMINYDNECISRIQQALEPLISHTQGCGSDLAIDFERQDFDVTCEPINDTDDWTEAITSHRSYIYSYTNPKEYRCIFNLTYKLSVRFLVRPHSYTDWYMNRIKQNLSDQNIEYEELTSIRWQMDTQNGQWFSQDILLNCSKAITKEEAQQFTDEWNKLNY